MNEFAMHDAVKEGDLERVRQLIAAGVSVNSLNEEGETPLHLAAWYGRYKVAGLLIDSGCDLDITDRCGRTPLMLAALWGEKDIVNLLLHRGAQVNGCGGETPLMCAARGGHKEVAKLLIRAGADVNRSDGMKMTALHITVFHYSTRVMQILLKKEGLDLNPQNVDGDTPLHLACRLSNFDAMKQLLDAGADVNLKNMRGRTALSEGIREGGLTAEGIGLFVQKGAFLENCDYECISRKPFLRGNVLKDVEFCTQSIVNKFNRQSLSALNSIGYFAGRLPNVNNFKLRAQHIDEVQNLVECEIERNTFCNVVKVRPIALSALCVLSLITCQTGKKRAASTGFSLSPFKKSRD